MQALKQRQLMYGTHFRTPTAALWTTAVLLDPVKKKKPPLPLPCNICGKRAYDNAASDAKQADTQGADSASLCQLWVWSSSEDNKEILCNGCKEMLGKKTLSAEVGVGPMAVT